LIVRKDCEKSFKNFIKFPKQSYGRFSCDNFIINNNYPEMLLEELKKLIAAKDEQIALLKSLLEKK